MPPSGSSTTRFMLTAGRWGGKASTTAILLLRSPNAMEARWAAIARRPITRVALTHLFCWRAGSVARLARMQAGGDQLCKRVWSLRDVRMSEARSMQRTWTGVLVADASPCSTTSGPFEIEFTRLKETAPDLRFTERFTWTSGRSVVSIDVWWDEWVEDYRIARIASCPWHD